MSVVVRDCEEEVESELFIGGSCRFENCWDKEAKVRTGETGIFGGVI